MVAIGASACCYDSFGSPIVAASNCFESVLIAAASSDGRCRCTGVREIERELQELKERPVE